MRGWEVPLGADAWAVLRAAAAGVALPPPFGLTPARLGLDDAAVAAAEMALRESGLAPGRTGGLVADLLPSVRAALALLGSAPVRLGLQAGDATHGLWASDSTLAGCLTLHDGTLRLGLAAAGEVPGQLSARLGHPAPPPTGTALVLDETRALAALAGPDPTLAAALLEPGEPAALADLVGRPRATALLTVEAARSATVVGLVRGSAHWWRFAPRADERLVLTPTDPVTLVADLLAGALTAGGPR